MKIKISVKKFKIYKTTEKYKISIKSIMGNYVIRLKDQVYRLNLYAIC